MSPARRDREFTDFVAARRTHLRRLAYGLCGDWHQADDLVQAALVKLYVAWPRLRRDGREEAYVRRILVRARIDEIRRPWRRENTTATPPERVEPPGLPVDERDALLTALQALPLMQRRTVLLRYWLELSITETAAELGVSTGTVKSHAARGLTALRAALSAPVS